MEKNSIKKKKGGESPDVDIITEFYKDYLTIKQVFLDSIHNVAERDRERLAQAFLSRLIFLFFLQQKRLLNNDQNYLSNLFNSWKGNFYRERLEPLFFDLLSGRKKAVDSFGQVPFLNYGLFTRSKEESKYPDLIIDNKVFLEIFQLLNKWEWSAGEISNNYHNLTPKILGHIFEKEINLFDSLKYHDPGKNKKTAGQISKGAYYTPVYITYYITREAISLYLLNRINQVIGTSYGTLEELLGKGNRAVSCKIFEIVAGLSVLDNAAGSGEFLMTALDVLADIYKKILTRLSDFNLQGIDIIHHFPSTVNEFNIKKFIVTENLFSVDIDEGAVEICKLRLWLALLSELPETCEKNTGLLEPLPNIDYNIVAGDSLDSLAVTGWTEDKDSKDKIDQFLGEHLQILRKYRIEHGENFTRLKDRIAKDRELIRKELFKNANEPNTVDLSDHRNTFHWGVNFPGQVLKGGFDVIIGNPPYIRIHRLEEKKKDYYNRSFKVASGQYDIYILFFERSIDLLSTGGVLGYITSSKYATAAYGRKLREYILENTLINQIIDVSRIPVFKDAMVYPYITILTRDQNKKCRSAHGIKIGLDLTEEHFCGRQIELLELPQRVFETLEDRSFPVETAGKWHIVKKIHRGSKRLKELVNIATGETGNLRKRIIVDEKKNANHFPVIEGKNVSEFGIDWTGKFINHDRKIIASPREKWGFKNRKLFQQPKIVLKDISKFPQGAYDDAGFFCLNTLYVITSKESASTGIPLKYILGIFNSYTIEFYFQVFFSGAHVSGGFLRFFKQYLEKIPIKTDVSLEKINEVIRIVDELSKLRKAIKVMKSKYEKKNPIDGLEMNYREKKKQLNDLVFDIYRITEREKQLVIDFLETKRDLKYS